MEKRNLLSEIGRSMLCLSLYCHHNNINKLLWQLERQLIWPRWNQEDARMTIKVNNWCYKSNWNQAVEYLVVTVDSRVALCYYCFTFICFSKLLQFIYLKLKRFI